MERVSRFSLGSVGWQQWKSRCHLHSNQKSISVCSICSTRLPVYATARASRFDIRATREAYLGLSGLPIGKAILSIPDIDQRFTGHLRGHRLGELLGVVRAVER